MTIRIAVFNDYPENLRLIREILTKKGFEVFTYQQNHVDLKNVEALNPNLVILAYLLGYDHNQLNIIDRLKEYPPTSALPIIICTTGVIESDGRPSMQNVPVIPKPFDISDLLEEVNRVLFRPDHPKPDGQ